MKYLIVIPIFVILISQLVLANKKFADDSPKLAILPPSIKVEGTRKQHARDTQDKFNPMDAVKHVMPRIASESKKKKWPLEIISGDETQEAYLAVMGESSTNSDDIKFSKLKPLAEKLHVRYLVRYTITELSSFRKTNTILRMAAGRASISLYIYDHDSNEYIWQIDRSDESAAGDFGSLGSLTKRQEQALFNALLHTLEPFAKGERKKIGRPKSDIIVNIQKLLADGKKVLIDVGSDKNVSEGDIFTSIESDAEIKIIKVLSNGAIAAIIKGMPKEKETFKSQD